MLIDTSSHDHPCTLDGFRGSLHDRYAIMLHPAQRFRAPTSITAGSPLKLLLDAQAISLIGESFVGVVPDFDPDRFCNEAKQNLASLGLTERAAQIAQCMARQFPEDFSRAARFLIASFGPPLRSTEGNGLAPFFYLPHAYFIAARGVDRFADGMLANYELTKRFTAEFSIRPFLVRYPAECLAMLATWVRDPDPHVRRLVSEGTRPRLPWAPRLPAFQRDPAPLLPLLEQLKDDPDDYVQRSVANHLGDLAKDHPEQVFALCRRWAEEAESLDPPKAKSRRWLLRHAVRLPAKQGNRQALEIRRMAAIRR